MNSVPCGGCGERVEANRCINCLHVFYPEKKIMREDESAWEKQEREKVRLALSAVFTGLTYFLPGGAWTVETRATSGLAQADALLKAWKK